NFSARLVSFCFQTFTKSPLFSRGEGGTMETEGRTGIGPRAGKERYMNIRTNLIRAGAALAAVLALAPSALALGGRVGDLAGPAAPAAVRRIPAASLTTAAQQTEADWRLLLVNPWNALP